MSASRPPRRRGFGAVDCVTARHFAELGVALDGPLEEAPFEGSTVSPSRRTGIETRAPVSTSVLRRRVDFRTSEPPQSASTGRDSTLFPAPRRATRHGAGEGYQTLQSQLPPVSTGVATVAAATLHAPSHMRHPRTQPRGCESHRTGMTSPSRSATEPGVVTHAGGTRLLPPSSNFPDHLSASRDLNTDGQFI